MTERNIYQLPDGDAIFLSMETANAVAHVGSLLVLDPSTRPGFGFEHFAAHIEERVKLVPRFTWKVREVPLGLDRPYWIADSGFRVRDHLNRIALPSPGGREELARVAGHLHSLPLDRTRPLWEMWLIEGLEGGRFAMYSKFHHCMMDGASGASLGDVITDLTADADGPPIVPEVYSEKPPCEPSPIELAWNAARNAYGRRQAFRSHARRGVRTLVRSALARNEEGAISDVPRLSFNTSIGRRRGFAWTSLPFPAVKDLKKHFDVKLNDVVLAVVSGAMRRHLRERGELPEQPLVALCPVATRAKDDKKLENQITQMAVGLATDSADPAERLRIIHESSKRSKEGVAGGSFDITAALGESLAPGAVGLLVRATDLAGDTGPLPGNLVVSNVRATPMPVYLAGARIESVLPMSMLTVTQGLNVTVVSYCNRIDVGLTFDPDLVTDAWRLTEQFPAALAELEAAAEGVVHRAG